MDGPGGRHLRTRAFGLELALDTPEPMLGLRPVTPDRSQPPTRVRVVEDADELAAEWPATGATRVATEDDGTGTPPRTIDRHPDAGYRFVVPGYGTARVSADGRSVRIAGPGAAGRLQRLLIGRVLPWTAVIRGREVLHASAVTIDGRVIALVGPSGSGKTSLAVALVLAGASLVCDDALAIDRGPDGRLRGHPGPATVGLRADAHAAMRPADVRALGALTELDGKRYATLPAVDGPLPLGALCLITRPPQPGPSLEPLAALDATLLMASTFVTGLDAPERLHRLFDLACDAAAALPALRVRVTPECGAAQLARALERWLRSVL